MANNQTREAVEHGAALRTDLDGGYEARLIMVCGLMVDRLITLGDVPAGLREGLARTAVELAGGRWFDAHEFTSAVLRRHGFEARPRDVGLTWMFRAERIRDI